MQLYACLFVKVLTHTRRKQALRAINPSLVPSLYNLSGEPDPNLLFGTAKLKQLRDLSTEHSQLGRLSTPNPKDENYKLIFARTPNPTRFFGVVPLEERIRVGQTTVSVQTEGALTGETTTHPEASQPLTTTDCSSSSGGSLCSQAPPFHSQVTSNTSGTRGPLFRRGALLDSPSTSGKHFTAPQLYNNQFATTRNEKRDNPPTDYRRYRENYTSALSQPHFSQTQELGTVETNSQSSRVESAFDSSTFQDGRAPLPSVHNDRELLHGEDRSERCLSYSGYTSSLTEVLPIPLGSTNLPISCHAIWAEHSTLCVYKAAQETSFNSPFTRNKNDRLPRRHAPDGYDSIPPVTALSDHAELVTDLGIQSQSGEIRHHTTTNSGIPGDRVRFHTYGHSGSPENDDTNQNSMSAFEYQRALFSTRTVSTTGSTDFRQSCHPYGSPFLPTSSIRPDPSSSKREQLQPDIVSQSGSYARLTMVDRSKSPMELKTHPETRNRHHDSDRLLPDRLGCSMSGGQSLRQLVSGRETAAYQFPRAESSILWNQTLCETRNTCSDPNRQHNSTEVPQQIRKNALFDTLQSCDRDTNLHNAETNLGDCGIYSRQREYHSRQSLSADGPGRKRLVPTSPGFQQNCATFQCSPSNRPVCLSPEHSARQICQLETRPASTLKWKYLGVPYLFPPMILIGRTLSKISEEKIEVAIIVVPFWTSRPWWPLLLQSLVQPPTLLLQIPSLLTNRNGESHPQILSKRIQMLAYLISGNSSKREEFQLDLQKLSSDRGGSQHSKHIVHVGEYGYAGALRGIKIPWTLLEDVVTFLTDIFDSGKSASWLATIRS